MDLSLFNHSKIQTYATQHKFDWIIIPREDEFLGEYVPDYNERLLWASGFSGSAGIAIIGQNTAHLFVDGRYTLQAADEAKGFEILSLSDVWTWINSHVQPSESIALNLRFHSHAFVTTLKHTFQNVQHIDPHPVDLLWSDRPVRPESEPVPHDIQYSGEDIASKIKRITAEIALGADALFVHDPFEVAWALNIRGKDVPFTPVNLARAIIWKTGLVDLFLHTKNTQKQLKNHFFAHINIFHDSDLENHLKAMSSVQIAPSSPAYYHELLLGKDIVQPSPISLMKALKNPVEIEGMRKAHRWDGQALRKFKEWLTTQDISTLNEIKASNQLELFRRECPNFKAPSFATISGFASNGAIIHYHATPKSNRNFTKNELYLVDSGGQYLEGTTDITRVFSIGNPTEEQRKAYTLVLKGHLRLAMAIFPKGTTGHQLDVLARHDLWQNGLNYSHGTGHGVGSYLSVHEGPHGISSRINTTPLQVGMIVSNEPGYYKAGEFGVRIENMMVVKESEYTGYLCFETLTQAPYEEALIDCSMLTESEISIVKQYV
jgi:Xaa-Pro aminopeptidase